MNNIQETAKSIHNQINILMECFNAKMTASDDDFEALESVKWSRHYMAKFQKQIEAEE